MKTSYDIRENILETYDHLDAIEITRGINGYPEGLHAAVTGFNSMEEAERIAEEFGGEVVTVHRRAGWGLWESKGWTTKAFGTERFDDEFRFIISCCNAVDELCRDFLDGNACDIEDVEQLVKLAKEFNDLYDAADNLNEDEILVVSSENYSCFTVEKDTVMEYCDDSHYFAIAVELEDTDEDEDEE